MDHVVLVVEDEPELRELMQMALEGSGYVVLAAADGEEALAAIRSVERLCLVLLDLLMPKMNGWEFVEWMRAAPKYADVPIIVHSSAIKDVPSGATRVLRKPVELDRLLSVVAEFCAH